jgi:hypothetical protein
MTCGIFLVLTLVDTVFFLLNTDVEYGIFAAFALGTGPKTWFIVLLHKF